MRQALALVAGALALLGGACQAPARAARGIAPVSSANVVAADSGVAVRPDEVVELRLHVIGGLGSWRRVRVDRTCRLQVEQFDWVDAWPAVEGRVEWTDVAALLRQTRDLRPSPPHECYAMDAPQVELFVGVAGGRFLRYEADLLFGLGLPGGRDPPADPAATRLADGLWALGQELVSSAR